MCGINGIYCYTGGARVDRRELVATRDQMKARGPDGFGEWVATDATVGLGHRRLAIIDLSNAGAQPMESGDGRYVVVFNGEIYNYWELREDLVAQGVDVPKSKSDTEVLLNLFARDGPGWCIGCAACSLSRSGMLTERRLFLARDPTASSRSITPNDGWTFRFASQVKVSARRRQGLARPGAGGSRWLLSLGACA